MRVRRLAICADDFALSEPVSRGILNLAGRGRLTAIAAMTAGARWPQAWQHLHEIPPDVALGLHLNFVEGDGLADGRPLPGAAWLAARAASFSMPRQALAREIAAQWQAFEDLAGRAPDFIDSHQHVHVLPPLRELVVDAVKRHGGNMVVRNLFPAFGPRNSAGKRLALRLLGAPALARRLQQAGLAANAAFGGLQDFTDMDGIETHWRAMLGELPDGALIACHPANGLDQGDPIGAFRKAEFDWLASSAFAQACSDGGIALRRPGVALTAA
jgi:predicted glycoside hydrolase/deacetylase ChbG (UPF0249 family)